jgi:hypothetical protein
MDLVRVPLLEEQVKAVYPYRSIVFENTVPRTVFLYHVPYVSETWLLRSRPISDHVPFMINIGTKIPKASSFKFENHWAEHKVFLKIVELHWNNAPYFANAATCLSQRLKQVRMGLKNWSKNFSNINRLHNSIWVLLLLDGLEEQRNLSNLERTLRKLVKKAHNISCGT